MNADQGAGEWEVWKPSRGSRIVNAAVGVVCGALAIGIVIGSSGGSDFVGGVAIALLVAAVALTSLVQAFWLRLSAGPSGLTVRNLRTTQIPWTEFQGCSVGVWGIWIRRHGKRQVIARAVDKRPVALMNDRTSADEAVRSIERYAQGATT